MVVAAVAVAANPCVNYPATAGTPVMMMVAAMVRQDFLNKFALAQRQNVGGVVTVRFQSQRPGGGGWDVPIEATSASFEHMSVVREAWEYIDACQAVEPNGLFIAASIHGDTSRMPGGNNKHFMHHLHNYIHTANRAQLDADGLHWILGFAISGYDTLSGGTPGMRDGAGGAVVIGDPGTVMANPNNNPNPNPNPNQESAW